MEIFGFEIKKKAVPTETVTKATQKAPMRPVGIVGMRTSSGSVEEEFLVDLQWPDAGRVYQEMASNDAVIGGCLYLLETLARGAVWEVEAASGDAGDIEAKDFVLSCMHDMNGQTWDDFICDALSMLVYGFSFHEIIYKTRRGPLERDVKFRSNYTDGRIGWQKLPIRSQASLDEWEINQDNGDVTGFIQDAGLVGLDAPSTTIPIEGNLLFRTKASRGNPEGWSLLRRAYRSWFFKRYIEELEGIGIERNLAGIPVLSPPPDTDLFNPDNEQSADMRAWCQSLVDGLRQDRNHGVILPSTDWELRLLSAESSNSNLDTDKIIRRHEFRMASSMLSDLILIGGDASGSFALAETKHSVLVSSLQAIVDSICYLLNAEAVPRLFAVNNWTLEKLPKIKATKLSNPTASEAALILRSLKTDVTRDPKLFNYLLEMIQAPTLSDEEYTAFMTAQAGSEGEALGDETDPALQDPVDNQGKQSDQLTRTE